MFTKTILTTAIVLGTLSSAFALEGAGHDQNLANRYPAFTGTAIQSAPVALQSRNVSLGGQTFVTGGYDRAGGSTDAGTGG